MKKERKGRKNSNEEEKTGRNIHTEEDGKRR